MDIENKIKNSNKEPKFSIIMATYNRRHILPRAIKSVLNQTFQDFEFIIVNDGSTDNTEKVINDFNDKRIIYLKHKKNKGVLSAQDTGIEAAKGEFIVWLGDDDELLREALEIIAAKINELSSKGVKILWFDSIDLDAGKCPSFNPKKEGFISYESLLCGRVYIDPIVAIDRSIRSNKRPDERSWGDMGMLWLRLYQENHKHKPFYVPKVVCKTRSKHGKHLSHPETSLEKASEVIFGQKTFLKQYREEIKSLCPERYGQRLALLGFYQILDGEKTEGSMNIRKSFRFNFSFKYYFIFLISFILNKNQMKFLCMKFLKVKRIINSVLCKCFIK